MDENFRVNNYLGFKIEVIFLLFVSGCLTEKGKAFSKITWRTGIPFLGY